MFRKLLNLFTRREPAERSAEEEEAAEKWYEEKSSRMEGILGKEHDMVMHAIIPYAIGGGLDLYYYPNDIEGVAVATKELSELPGEGSSNAVFDLYEFAMFTRLPLNLEAAKDAETPFGQTHTTINAVLNTFAPYSAQATLNPCETCEFPADMEKIGGKCFLLDSYKEELATQGFGVMVILEVFRSEMQYAREHGGQQMLDKLKAAGVYPYSDMDREPLV